MATRYPLVIDTSDGNKIKELPNGDNLNLTGNNIVNVVNVTATGALSVSSVEVTSNTFTVNGNSLNTVAFTGNYADLTGAPTAFNGNYDNLTNKPTLKTTIESLDNVSTTAPTNNQVLQYDSSTGTYKPSSIASVSASSIDALLDVNVSNIASAAGQILKWDGSAWIRGNASSGQDADTLDSYEGTYYLNYNNFTNKPNVLASVTADDTDTFTATSNTDNFKIYGGTGVTTSILNDVVTITNSAPDQTVAFTNGTNITVTGTYPNFTISSNALAGISVGTPATPNSSGSIAYNAGVITFTPPDLSGYITNTGVLSSHTDVATTTPNVGEVLKWSGSTWEPSDDSIQDIKGSVFGDDSTLLVDGVNSKLYLGANNLAELANVDTTAPTSGQVLKWSGTAWAPAADGGGSGSGGGTLVENVVDYTASGTDASRSIADGAYLTDRSNNTISAQITIPSGSTKNIVEFRGQFSSTTETTGALLTFERQINSGSFVAVKTQLIDNLTGQGTDSILLDTHGASAGDTVTYRIKNASGDARTLFYYSTSLSAYMSDSVFSVRAVGATTGGGGGGGGNETFVDFAASGTDLTRTIAPGSYLKDRSGNDIEAQITISSGGTKNLVRFHGSIYTTANTPTALTVERSVNSGAYTTVKTMPGGDTYGSDSVIIDTHGASAGDTVKYKIKNSMTGSTNSTLYYAGNAAGNYPAMVYESVFSVREIGVSASGGGGSGDIEAVTAGTGLTGGGTTGSVTLNVDVGTTANKIVQLDSTGKLPAIDGSQLTNVSGGGGGTQNLFSTIAVSGQNSVVADATTDELTLVAGTNISITTDATNDTITFASSGGGGTQNVFSAIAVAGQNSVVADTTTDILTLAEGGGINITTNDTTDTVTLATYLHSATAGTVNKLDSIAFIDADDNSTKKATITSLITEIAGTNLAVSGNQLNATVGLTNIVEDTSPQLGGDLDMNGKQIQYTFNITASGTDHYVFNDGGNVFFTSGGVNDPTLYLKRGEIYVFNNTTGGHPLRIQSTPGVSGTPYNTGVTNNGNTGAVTFKVPNDAPHQLYYQCTSHGNMRGVIYIDAVDLDSVSQSAITTGSDSIVFIDSSDENKTKKEPISAFLTDIAGTGLTVTSDQLTAADTFVALSDTPANFTSAGGKIVKVNSGASALEFADNNIVSQLNSYVTVTDTGTDGTVTLHTDGTDRWKVTSGGHLIPQSDAAYDIGSASNKIRHIFISDNSIKFGAAELAMTVTASRLHFNSNKLMINVSDDSAPTLAGNLDVATHNIVSTTNQDITLAPHGTGKVNVSSTLNITGNLQGPASFTIDPAVHDNNTGTVIIAGNLQVDGTTTTINSTTLDIDDLNITVAKGAADAAAANGAGLTVDGASATFTYASSGDRWESNKTIWVNGSQLGSGGTTTGKAIAMAMVFG